MHRIFSLIDDSLVLRLSDRTDYANAGLKLKDVPEDMVDGRAISPTGSVEIQIGMISSQSSTVEQNAVIQTISSNAEARWGVDEAHLPVRIDPLPASVRLADVEVPNDANDMSMISPVIGVGGNQLSAMRMDLLSDGPFFIIAGQPKTGRSAAAATIAQSVLNRGGGVIAVCPRRSPLTQLDGQEHFVLFKGAPAEAETLVASINAFSQPIVIIVDDSDVIAGNPFDETLRQVMRQYSSEIASVVVGSFDNLRSQISGIGVDARKTKIGLLLSPQLTLDGDLVGMRLPRNVVGRMPPGRGLLCRHGQVQMVQVPTT